MKKILLLVIAAFGFGRFTYATITCIPSTLTNQDVVATITGTFSGITNNGGSTSHTFTDNGSFTFEYINADETTGSETQNVDWIDKTVPIGTIVYSTTGITTGNIAATISFDETGVTSNVASHTFTGNGTFTFTFQDTAGNTGSQIATVTWITGAVSTGTVSTGTINTGTNNTGTNNTGTIATTLTDEEEEEEEEEEIVQTGLITSQLVLRTGASIANSTYSDEMKAAYIYAYGVGITDMKTIQKANLDGKITRRQLAKMLSVFATKALDKVANTGVNCAFSDVTYETTETKGYAKLACQLGLMGMKPDGTPNTKFNPGGEVTRKQFGTILSRLLRGTVHENSDPDLYYVGHLNALKAEGIMTKIETPADKEKRGLVMLMFMRTAE